MLASLLSLDSKSKVLRYWKICSKFKASNKNTEMPMKQITLDWLRLAKYSLLFIVFAMLITLIMMTWLTGSITQAIVKSSSLTAEEITLALELSLTILIYLGFPILLIRLLYYFTKMLSKGRRPGINIITAKTLFNPINFLLFPSLLNSDGLTYRRRCILSILLLLGLYGTIFVIT